MIPRQLFILTPVNSKYRTRAFFVSFSPYLRHRRLSNRPRVGGRDRIQEIMSTSLMLVTALNPKIGYDNASKVLQSRAC